MNIGDAVEAAFAYWAIQQGFEIFQPLSHHTKTDVVIRKPNGPFIGVQIKKGSLQKQSTPNHKKRWKFLLGSGLPSVTRSKKDNDRKDKRKRYNLYKSGDFQILAVFIMELETWAFYRLEDVIGNASKSWNQTDGPHNNWEIFSEKY